MSRSPRWDEALHHGDDLLSHCVAATRDAVPVAVRETRWWALLVYATAAQHELPVGQVEAAQVRYRLTDAVNCLVWLGGILHARGHAVTVPRVPVAIATGETIPWELARVERREAGLADDPVVTAWEAATAFDEGSILPLGEGFETVTPTCPLWTARPFMATLLDALLIHDGGGWPVGTRVRTTTALTVPPEEEVASDRGIVTAPVWILDEATGQVLTPPAGYLLCLRPLDAASDFGGVPVEVAAHSVLADPGGWPPQPEQSPITPVPATGTPTSTNHARGIPPERSAAERDLFTPDLLTALEVAVPGQDRSTLPYAMAATQEPARVRALERLWRMRQSELDRRYDQASPPIDLPLVGERMLRLGEETLHRVRQSPRAAWCPPDTRLLRDRPRWEMLAWLAQLIPTATADQVRLLDFGGQPASMSGVRALLAEEGFLEVTEQHPTSPEGSVGGGDLVAVNPGNGRLVHLQVHTVAGKAEVESVTFWHCTALLDAELGGYGAGSGVFARDADNPALATNISCGQVASIYCYGGARADSLRLAFAVLDAAGDPVLPWYQPPPGLDPGLVARLPDWVHELLGPHLYHRHR
ncbi:MULTISPECIES: hypothetical protein [unclassified Crossiella]|uniref:hypothetical protein n=1 Tax=unclassified Crossiella TaxID=2620835 RepID=UPI001FFE9119|nr:MULTISPECIES: hypothetical protein [unclassified Crossiella]MCK2240084.1 hypothetical protein [Crossiella sp. S99.2]MCK2252793.1 hypothetical protein [Crossiella sp. S99.1]